MYIHTLNTLSCLCYQFSSSPPSRSKTRKKTRKCDLVSLTIYNTYRVPALLKYGGGPAYVVFLIHVGLLIVSCAHQGTNISYIWLAKKKLRIHNRIMNNY